MTNLKQHFSRVVIGGGIFGCYAALVLADKGHNVLLVEKDNKIFNRASYINQARIHTGLHYPRSLKTAVDSFGYYQRFRTQWPQAVRDFDHIYAISKFNSKTSYNGLVEFARRLNLPFTEIDPRIWFNVGSVEGALKVEEPTFDSKVLGRLITDELTNRPNIQILLSTEVLGGKAQKNNLNVNLGNGKTIETDGIVIAGYASTNSLRSGFNLEPISLTFELTEILLGNALNNLKGFGFTVMDGPFWSLMPFGHSNFSSLTSVGFTPHYKSRNSPEFPCQSFRSDCSSVKIQDCTTCISRPITLRDHHLQQMKKFLKFSDDFFPVKSLFTVKSILTSSDVDDSRPTLVLKENDINVATIFSGKVSTIFDLEKELT